VQIGDAFLVEYDQQGPGGRQQLSRENAREESACEEAMAPVAGARTTPDVLADIAEQATNDREAAEEETAEEAGGERRLLSGLAVAARVDGVIGKAAADKTAAESSRPAFGLRLATGLLESAAGIFVDVVVANDASKTCARRLHEIHDEHDGHNDDVDRQQSVLQTLQSWAVSHLHSK